ncbi:hypothetical protein Leryth_021885 [Lithospermum erythrorhizon]|nr:hypothetical protein Leryth_021885 [Lithospermum erythrorhizon]
MLKKLQRSYPFIFQYGHGDSNEWSNKYLSEAPMKKLINEMSQRANGSHTSPSVIARLMGVELLPADTKSKRQQVESRSETQVITFPKVEELRTSSGSHVSFASNTHRRKKYDSREHKLDGRTNRQKSHLNPNKPKPREHPQEDELQKFKKEFEAYQAARIKKYLKVIEGGRLPGELLAQEELNKEKMTLYANSIRSTDDKKPKDNEVKNVSTSKHRKGNRLKKFETLAADMESLGLSSNSRSPDFQQWSLSSSDNISEASHGPSNIVILNPGSDTIGYAEESWTNSSGISVDRGSIEDFLEEVKERLKHELNGKPYKWSAVRGGGIETPYSERPSDASPARETPYLGMMLPRSASTRSYRSVMKFNETGSPEFDPKDTRRLLKERLKIVLKEEKNQDIFKGSYVHTRSSDLAHHLRNWDSQTNDSDEQSRCIRPDPDDIVMHQEELSPTNLNRSFSAPVSTSSFGNLLLEDRHMLTEPHIRRNPEVIEKSPMNLKSRKKQKSKFREKVSSFKYSLTLRGRLFGKKFRRNNDSMKDIQRGPTYMLNYNDRLENLTEVPPSPASICSSAHEESWRATDCFSPTSASDVHSADTSMMPQAFREISSNLNELRKQLHQLETEGSEATIADDQHNEVEWFEIEDEVEAYIRDLLVASGLYDGSSDTSLSRWDPLGKPISNQVFEEVEESYRKRMKDDDDEVSSKDQVEILNHMILFDVLNEVLPTTLGAPAPMSRFLRTSTSPAGSPLRGKNLLVRVWEVMCNLAYPQEDAYYYTIAQMVARDLQSTSWCKWIEDYVYSIGKDIESHIMGDLIEEIVNKFH